MNLEKIAFSIKFSNPRYCLTQYTRLAGGRLQPLGHLSKIIIKLAFINATIKDDYYYLIISLNIIITEFIIFNIK